MSADDDYERGYHGHGRGLVVTQPRPGEFEERPMTAAELAARAPAWAIGADIYEFTRAAAFAYIRCWEIIAPVIEAAVAEAEREAAHRQPALPDGTSEQPKMLSADTYAMPAHGWTCFHCGETFKTPGDARDHFGASPMADPGCFIRVQAGEERGLLMALRQAEKELERYRAEDSDKDRAMHAMQADHAVALRREEEAGYAKGLRDGQEMTARDAAIWP